MEKCKIVHTHKQIFFAKLRLNAVLLTSQTIILDLCENVVCKYGARCEAGECVCPTNCEGSGDESVCASNMMTYPNECEMQKVMCQDSNGLNEPLSVVFYGDCSDRFPVGSSKFGVKVNFKLYIFH